MLAAAASADSATPAGMFQYEDLQTLANASYQLVAIAAHPAEVTTAVTRIPTADTSPTRLFVSATDKLVHEFGDLVTMRHRPETEIVTVALFQLNYTETVFKLY